MSKTGVLVIVLVVLAIFLGFIVYISQNDIDVEEINSSPIKIDRPNAEQQLTPEQQKTIYTHQVVSRKWINDTKLQELKDSYPTDAIMRLGDQLDGSVHWYTNTPEYAKRTLKERR